MIEIMALGPNQVLSICLKGVQEAEEFEVLADSLCELTTLRRMHLLFDWTELEGFDDRRRFSQSCRHWGAAANHLARTAIVHHLRWNQQAALFAAVLRAHGVQVRSWRVDDHPLAASWLMG
jgi:hypothetical protein